MIGYVRFGSKADMCVAKRHVCFTLESGHVRCTSSCLLWAREFKYGAIGYRRKCPLVSKADICAARGHVRFAPESGHVQCS